MCLLLKDLWPALSEERPEARVAGNEWDRKDSHALAMIHLNCEPEQQQLIVDCDTALAAWETLSRKFEAPTMANVTYLEEEFHRLKLEKNQTVEQFCSEVKALASRLATLQAPVSTQRIISKILHGLPGSFDALVMGLSLPNVGELQVEDVVEQVIAAEQRMSLRVQGSGVTPATAEVTTGPTALLATTGEDRRNLVCHYCKRRGHSSNVCYDKYPKLRPSHWGPPRSSRRSATPPRRRDDRSPRGRESGNRSRSREEKARRSYTYARGRGRSPLQEKRSGGRNESRGRSDSRSKRRSPVRHRSKSCSRTISPKRSKSKEKAMVMAAEPLFEHNFSMQNSREHWKQQTASNNSTTWLWDSGASSHMTADAGIFSSLKRITPFSVLTGNGFLQAKGVGRISITLDVHGERNQIEVTDVLWIPELTGGYNLLSVPRLTKMGYTVTFSDSEVTAKLNGVVCAVGSKGIMGNAWVLKLCQEECFMSQKGRTDTQPIDVWHARLGHLNKEAITKLATLATGMVIGEPRRGVNGCVDCL